MQVALAQPVRSQPFRAEIKALEAKVANMEWKMARAGAHRDTVGSLLKQVQAEQAARPTPEDCLYGGLNPLAIELEAVKGRCADLVERNRALQRALDSAQPQPEQPAPQVCP